MPSSNSIRSVRAGASTPSVGANQSNYNMRLSVPYMLVASLLTGMVLYMATHVFGQNSSYGMSNVNMSSSVSMITWKVYAAVAFLAGVFHFTATLSSQIGCTTDIKEDAGWSGLQAVGMIVVTLFTLFGLNMMAGVFTKGAVSTAFIMMIVLPALWWGVSLFFNFLIMLSRDASDKCP